MLWRWQPPPPETVVTHLSSQLMVIQHKLQGLDTAVQRYVLFSEYICKMQSTDASALFAEICRRPVMTRNPMDILVAEATFNALIAEVWPEEHIRHTREAAAYLDEEVTLALLVMPRAIDEFDDTFQIPKYTAERVLTLGERKFLAAMPVRDTLEKAMMDPHPDVARKLLDNPRLTEDDVVRISAKSTIAPSVLCKIAAHPRWRRQPIVQRALIHNRLLPADFAITLLPFLERRIMRDVSRDARLDTAVRQAASVLLASIESALSDAVQ